MACEALEQPNTCPGTVPNKKHSANTNARDGIASIFACLSFIIGFSIFSTTLYDLEDDDVGITEKLEVLKDNEKVYYLSNMILYILFGVAQLILAIGLAQSSKRHFPATAPISQGLGIIWSTLVMAAGMIGNIGAQEVLDILDEDPEGAAALWTVVRTIHSGLGGGNEIVAGFWVLFAGWSYFMGRIAIKKVTLMDRIVFGICNIAGCAGILSTVPVLADSSVVTFGVGMIVWYALMGILLVARSFDKDE